MNRIDYQAVWDAKSRKDYVDNTLFGATEEEYEHRGKDEVNDILLPHIPHPAGAVVLEVGCGAGRLMKYLSPFVKELHGLDVSEVMLDLARSRLQGLANIHLHHHNGYDLSLYPDRTFDFLYCILVLQHLEKEDAFVLLEEFGRVLRPEGQFLLHYPNFLSELYFSDFVINCRNESRDPTRVRSYTGPEIRRMMEATGFHIIKMFTRGYSFSKTSNEIFDPLDPEIFVYAQPGGQNQKTSGGDST